MNIYIPTLMIAMFITACVWQVYTNSNLVEYSKKRKLYITIMLSLFSAMILGLIISIIVCRK